MDLLGKELVDAVVGRRVRLDIVRLRRDQYPRFAEPVGVAIPAYLPVAETFFGKETHPVPMSPEAFKEINRHTRDRLARRIAKGRFDGTDPRLMLVWIESLEAGVYITNAAAYCAYNLAEHGRRLKEDPETVLERDRQTANAIFQMLRDLPAQARAVLCLRWGFVEDRRWPVEEVGAVLGLTKEKVRVLEARWTRETRGRARRAGFNLR